MIQSILFNKDKWTPNRARKWLMKHGFKYGKLHETDRYLRYRQTEPRPGSSYRILPYAKCDRHDKCNTNMIKKVVEY